MRAAIDTYHKFYEERKLWADTKWLGFPMWKLPFDAITAQEIIFETRPDLIIETGTGLGGSAMFYASLCQLMDHGAVITIDLNLRVLDFGDSAAAQRLKYITGSSINPMVLQEVRAAAAGKRCMVILDSWHAYDHVLAELKLYSPLVAVGCYLIVEDTHVSGHPVPWQYGPGPFEAVQDFLQTDSDFEVDYARERHLMSFNPGGFLKRVRKGGVE